MLEINNTTKQKINLKKTAALAEDFLRVYKKAGGEVSLAIVGDARMRSLNYQYRGIDKATDVLSFVNSNLGGGPAKKLKNSDQYLGEIVINIQEARRGKKYQEMLRELGMASGQISADYIFYFLLIHGLLHLLGYDDQTVKGRQKMLKRGQDFLSLH